MHPLYYLFLWGSDKLIINKDNLEKKDIKTKIHKVRAIIYSKKGKIYITNMDNSYNLPGGHVENKEDIKDALKRELEEELGIKVLKKEMNYIGNYIFYHKDFPGEKGKVNRENNVDLFYILEPKEINLEHIKLTNYEKHYHFQLMECSVEEILKLLQEKNANEYKNFTDIELKICIEEFIKYRKEENIC